MTVEVAEGQVREQSFGLQAEYDAIMTETSNASKSWVEGPFKLISSAKSGDSVKKTTDLDIRLQLQDVNEVLTLVGQLLLEVVNLLHGTWVLQLIEHVEEHGVLI